MIVTVKTFMIIFLIMLDTMALIFFFSKRGKKFIVSILYTKKVNEGKPENEAQNYGNSIAQILEEDKFMSMLICFLMWFAFIGLGSLFSFIYLFNC